MPQIQKLVSVHEMEYPVGPDDQPLSFKIELYTSGGSRFTARVFRYDVFRLSPSFGPASKTGADHEMVVLDPTFGRIEVEATNGEKALDAVLNRIQSQLRAS